MRLDELKPCPGAKRKPKRVGRGPGSGSGKTAGRGSKGQKSRSGRKPSLGFEGGQMPLTRRLPKRGFTNIFKKTWAIINLRDLAGFPAHSVVDADALKAAGLIRKPGSGIKLLAQGEVTVPLTIRVQAASARARAQIEAQGGRVEVI